MACLVNYSIGSLAHFLQDLIFFVDVIIELFGLFHRNFIINYQI
jgi:hypothetical protein